MRAASITPLEGPPRIVRVGLGDRVAWEAYARKSGFPMVPAVRHPGTDRQEVDVAGFPIETYQAFLAYSADTRTLERRPPFIEWLEGVTGVEEVPTDEPDPTQ